MILFIYFIFCDSGQASNILFVDQPTGTGFSYTTNQNDIRHDEKGVSNDLYDFLQVSSGSSYSLNMTRNITNMYL